MTCLVPIHIVNEGGVDMPRWSYSKVKTKTQVDHTKNHSSLVLPVKKKSSVSIINRTVQNSFKISILNLRVYVSINKKVCFFFNFLL